MYAPAHPWVIGTADVRLESGRVGHSRYRPAVRSTAYAILAASALLALTPPVAVAKRSLPLGRYHGATSDGHVIEFTVERSPRPTFPRKITHFHVVYDIAGCRSGPIRQPFFAKVYYGKTASRRGSFSRLVGHPPGKPGQPQLDLTGRFTSASAASGSFRVGVRGSCPLDPASTPLTFHVKRAS
jgi:hypothetical protein